MSHQAIYRKWRPMIFEDIVGQEHITKTLKNQILSGKIGHAYLFCGTRGTGKTTCAKVFSRAVNCLDNHNGSPCNKCDICRGIIDGSILDVTEIDAASNNGVDNIREIRDDVRYIATAAKYTVYIIDEVHMLSGGAFNALLKTLEEPPEHVIFILATTEPQKVPQTILSRCQRFDFRRIKPSDIILRMKEIAYGDGLDISDDAYNMLARLADGSMRDALSFLERVVSSSGNTVTAQSITDTLGISTLDNLYSITDCIINADIGGILSVINKILDDGKDLRTFIESLIKYFRDLMILKVSSNSDKTLDYSSDEIVRIKNQCGKLTFEKISHAISVLTDAQAQSKFIKSPRVVYELALIKIAKPQIDDSMEAVADRVAALEQKVGNNSNQHILPSNADIDIEQRIDQKIAALEKRLQNKIPNPPAVSEPKQPSKKEIPKRLYNPIPPQQLHSENQIVKIAKNWTNITKSILDQMPHLMASLMNRDITIDADGIILLYKREERLSQNIALKYISDIQKCLKKAVGSDYQVKAVCIDDLDDENIIDFWDLKPPSDIQTPMNDLNKNVDPLDNVIKNFSEIIDRTDEKEFLNYENENNDFFQSSFEEREEFLEENEIENFDE